MAVYKILDQQGQVLNRVVANEDFMVAQYPQGNYEQEPEAVVEAETPAQPE